MDNIEPKVLGSEPDGSVVEKPTTPAEQGVVKETTPTQLPSDAEVARLKADYDKALAELRNRDGDLNKMKSTLQKQIAQSERTWAEKERQWKQELENIRVQGMDEEQRKAYESTRVSSQLEELQQRLAELEEEKQNAEAKLAANNYFLSKGVPASALVSDQGYEELWNSGMEWLDQELQRLRNPQTTTTAPVTKPTPPSAPPVDTGSGTPSGGPTWEELRAKYGSDERVYELIEQRRLSPDILPKPK